MFESQIAVYSFLNGYLRNMLADIEEKDFDAQPIPGGNTPRWILTHLAICNDYAAKALGGKRDCPREWHAGYGPGSSPTATDIPKPTKAELIAALDAGQAAVISLAEKADPAALAQPHTLDFLKPTPIQTQAHFVSHLMTSHFAGHVGQLSYWRRAMGKAPLF